MKKKRLILPLSLVALAAIAFSALSLQNSKNPILLLNVEALSQDETSAYGMHPEPWGDECIFVDANGDSVFSRKSICKPTSDLSQTCTEGICLPPYK